MLKLILKLLDIPPRPNNEVWQEQFEEENPEAKGTAGPDGDYADKEVQKKWLNYIDDRLNEEFW